MKHMIQPFGIDMHKNVLTDTKAVKHMHFYEADKTNTILNISFIPSYIINSFCNIRDFAFSNAYL